VKASGLRFIAAAAGAVVALQLVSGQTQPPTSPLDGATVGKPAQQQQPPLPTSSGAEAGSGSPAKAAAADPATAGRPQTPPQQPPPRPQPSFRAGIDLVSLNVTVTDGTAHYVTDLAQEDFNVYEDGVKQEVTFFNRTNLPIALALLLDTSASMEAKLANAQEAAIGFARKLRSQDLAEVIDFDSRVVILQNFTNVIAELEAAIRKTSAGGSTSLYNAVYIALKDLKKVVARNVDDIRRQAIVVLSDGEDTSSLLPFEEVLDLAKRSETAIYTIGLRSEGPSTSSRGFKEAEFVLRQFSQETGGRSFFPNQIGELTNVYGQIADELSSQYTVGYTSRNPKRDGSWRRLVVRVNRPNLTARTKQGYFAPTSH
jgi:Ca-activated chloride channel homolog